MNTRSTPHTLRARRAAGLLCAAAATLAQKSALAQQQPSNELAPMTIQANGEPAQQTQSAPHQQVEPAQAPIAVPPPAGNVGTLEIQSPDPSIQLVFNAANNMPQHLQPRGNDPLAPCTAPCNRPVARDELAYVISPNSRPSNSFVVNPTLTRLLVEPALRSAYDGMAVMRTTGFIVGGIGLFGVIYGAVYALPLLLVPSSASTMSLDPIRTLSYVLLGGGGALLIGGGILGVYGQVSLGNMQTRVYDQNRQRLARRPAVQWIGNGILF